MRWGRVLFSWESRWIGVGGTHARAIIPRASPLAPVGRVAELAHRFSREPSPVAAADSTAAAAGRSRALFVRAKRRNRRRRRGRIAATKCAGCPESDGRARACSHEAEDANSGPLRSSESGGCRGDPKERSTAAGHRHLLSLIYRCGRRAWVGRVINLNGALVHRNLSEFSAVRVVLVVNSSLMIGVVEGAAGRGDRVRRMYFVVRRRAWRRLHQRSDQTVEQ